MAPPGKKRRIHNKSRRGCLQCKERHIKCDEQPPSCAHCTVTNRTCSYSQFYSRAGVTPSAGSNGVSPRSETRSVSVSASASVLSPPNSNPSDSGVRDAPQQVFDLSHLALLHHLETNLVRETPTQMFVKEADAPLFVNMMITAGLSMPYLMDEILAFSALHLSVITSDVAQRDRYRHQAMELQTRALSLYHAANPEVTEENCAALLMFSSFIGMHMLYDSVTGTTDRLELLDKFVQFTGLYHGVGIVVDNRWHVIRESELSVIVEMVEEADSVPIESGGICEHLSSLLATSKDRLGPSALEACEHALDSLKWTFHQHNVLRAPIDRHIVFAWPVRITTEFLDMLRSRQPEALIIMAYWGLLLHYARDFWIFGTGGRSLIDAIQNYLGSYWDRWLTPLRECIDTNSDPLN